ncbi:alpha/beta hydrolase fold domain-containing protein [Prosthecobacter sp.]|uniref:alpha/beta hydrolase fold domain-containing protein n=1 Tax=Prosthecobacter sp. TaxID=1965333 RepID=UPI0037831C9A
MNTPLILILLVMMSATLTGAEVAGEPTFKDVSYGPHDRNKLDVWQAKGEGAKPLLIFIHGGGWAGGSKADVPVKLLNYMLAQGVSVASINYRYSTQAVLPAPVHDAARAVQYLRSMAGEWKLKSERFAAYGISAGATTSLWLAYHEDLADAKSSDAIARLSTRLCAAVALSPQTSIEPEVITGWVGEQVLLHPMMARAVGAKRVDEMKQPKAEWVKVLHEFSPITHVSRDDPPVLISNPRVDPLPATNAGSAIHHAELGAKLKEKADEAGARCILRIEEKATVEVPKPEAFLLEELRR